MDEEKPLTKTQTLTTLAETTGKTKKEIAELLDVLVNLAYKEVIRSGKFTIPGIGALKKVERKARMGRHPITGEAMKIPAKTVTKFTLAKAAKEAITPPKQ